MHTPTDPAVTEADAWDELTAARRHVEALRRLVHEGKAGAASLHAAEYALHGCLERVRRLGWTDPLEPADDDPEAA